VELLPVDEVLNHGGLTVGLDHVGDPSLELDGVEHHRPAVDAGAAVLPGRLDDRREQIPVVLSGLVELRPARHRHSVLLEQRADPRLVVAESDRLGRGSGVGEAELLEDVGDLGLAPFHAGEELTPVEDHGLGRVEGRQSVGQVVAPNLQHPDPVTAAADGGPEATALAGDPVLLVRLPLRVHPVEEKDIGGGWSAG
jgi:hypothetical protein